MSLSKYPPAEPGALGFEPLKAAVGVRFHPVFLLSAPVVKYLTKILMRFRLKAASCGTWE
jgi:hypothetical protein